MRNSTGTTNLALVSGAALALGTSVASAAIDLSPITAALTDVNAVGVAVFALIVAAAVYKWIRRAL